MHNNSQPALWTPVAGTCPHCLLPNQALSTHNRIVCAAMLAIKLGPKRRCTNLNPTCNSCKQAIEPTSNAQMGHSSTSGHSGPKRWHTSSATRAKHIFVAWLASTHASTCTIVLAFCNFNAPTLAIKTSLT